MSDSRTTRISGSTLRRTLIMAGAGGVAAAGLLGPGTASADAAPSCSDVEVVFARGTAEPAGVGREGQSFVDTLKSRLPGRSVGVYAVNYPASYDFLKSAPAGAADAAAHIQATAAACGDTRIVLGGYSQGAAVVDLITADPGATFGFGQPMPAAIADHVDAVAVFGNPAGKIGKTLPANSPLYGAKAIDLCNGADPVCSPGDDRPAHSQYIEAGLTRQGADFAADRVSAAPSALMVNTSGTVG